MKARHPVFRITGPALRLMVVSVVAVAVTACSQSMVLKPEAEVPPPLASQLPLHIAVHYPEEFRTYVYEENSDDRQNWSIDCGPSQVVLFDQVLPALFAEVSHVNEIHAAAGSGLDAILVPRVEDMQFALPHETRTELYEAWLRYSITLYEPDGRKITEFPLTGYGKSTTSLFSGREDGLNSAINEAFRDVGARLTLGFRNNQAVRPWLLAKQAEAGAGAGP
ncbi:hypothetical protein [Elongatibacter sediminis]|uniref:ABC-type transport auxiliary lipoprotein component domain-containing protein n=1 Tax=Elongatibacter sediminis TaxID=3119006 RepID=A0AAW9R9L0_9GAMM